MGTEIHWLGAIVGGIAAFMVGGIWYSALFGRAWMAARGVTRETMRGAQANVKLLFALTFLLDLFMAFVLDHVLGTYGNPKIGLSLMIAGGMALGFVIPAMLVNYLYQQASRNLMLIDAGHWLFAFLAMGAVESLFA